MTNSTTTIQQETKSLAYCQRFLTYENGKCYLDDGVFSLTELVPTYISIEVYDSTDNVDHLVTPQKCLSMIMQNVDRAHMYVRTEEGLNVFIEKGKTEFFDGMFGFKGVEITTHEHGYITEIKLIDRYGIGIIKLV